MLKPAPCLGLAIAGALALSASGADPAAVFAPNHLFVTDRSGLVVHEFDGTFALVRTIDVSGVLAGNLLQGVAFGPDNNLTVIGFNGTLAVLDADLNVVRTQAIGTAAQDIAYGMDGHQFISIADDNHASEFDKDGGLIAHRGSVSLPVGMEIDPAGCLYLAGWGPAELVRVDRSGPNLASFGGAVATDAWEMRFGPGGRLFVADDTANAVLEIDMDGTLADSFGAGQGFTTINTFTFGPDGAIYVSDDAALQIHRITMDDDVDTVLGGGLVTGIPTGLAWSPFRLAAKITGNFHRDGNTVKVKEKDALLLIAPYSNTFFIQLQDDLDDNKDLATLSGSDQWVYNGFDLADSAAPETRILTGSSFANNTRSRGATFAALTVEGEVAENGMFLVHTAKGDIHFTTSGGSFLGSIKAKTVPEIVE